MLFFVHYVLKVNGLLVKEKQGLIWGGNHKIVMQSACHKIEGLEYNKSFVISDNEYFVEDGISSHRILVSCPNELVTTKEV